MIEFLIPAFPLFASELFPDAPAKININHDTINAIVKIVPIKKVADNKISWTNNSGELSYPALSLIFKNS
jgi:hypothetical protein